MVTSPYQWKILEKDENQQYQIHYNEDSESIHHIKDYAIFYVLFFVFYTSRFCTPQLTAKRRQLFSLTAPQHPKNPIKTAVPPLAIRTSAPVRISEATSKLPVSPTSVRIRILSSSSRAQIPSPTVPRPISCNGNQFMTVKLLWRISECIKDI